jgi:1,4-dihydroxy-6-naphthoate synthase
MDLGEYWEKETNVPIPLGGIAVKKNIDKTVIYKIDQVIKSSVEYGYQNHYSHLTDFVKQNAQDMREDVMRHHINLYVNNYSIYLGNDGKDAIRKLLRIYEQLHRHISKAGKIFYDE